MIIGYEGKQNKILVVDNSANNRTVLVNFLSSLGFKLLEASNEEEALALAQENHPDLILIDWMMSNTNGLRMTSKLRQESSWQDVAIVAISASVLPEAQSSCEQADCNAFLAKPISFDNLLNVIADLLGLQWIYQDAPSSIQATAAELLITLPQAEIAALSKLVMQGELREILTQAARLKQEQPQYSSFVNKVIQLAESCQIERLQQFLSIYLKL